MHDVMQSGAHRIRSSHKPVFTAFGLFGRKDLDETMGECVEFVRCKLALRNCVRTNTRLIPELMQFEMVTSMSRYFPNNGTAGFALS